MIKVAITGNIASGKSEVEKIIKNMGYVVYDADKIAHDNLGFVKHQLTAAFGKEILINGEISRAKLGNIVFNDNRKLKKLDSIIHPEVIKDINALFKVHEKEKYIFVSVPLLFEAKMDSMFDKIIFVYADDKIRLERLMKRNNLNKTAALQRLNAQQSQEEKIVKSDYVIKNEGSLEDLEYQLQQLF